MIIKGKCDRCGKANMNPDCERCRFVWFINQTAHLRAAQKRYFQSRKAVDRQEARRMESLIDSALKRVAEVHEQTSFEFGANV